MSDSLYQRLKDIRIRVRRLVWLNGLSRLVAVVVAVMLVCGVLDWLIHFDDPYARVVLLAVITGSGFWVVWRGLLTPLITPFSDLDLARRLQRRFPELKDGLASTIEFIEHKSDPRLGSPELQKLVIQETLDHVEAIDVSDVIEPRQVRRTTLTAVAVVMLVALVAGLNRVEAKTAIARIVFPFAQTQWPRETELELLGAGYTELELGEGRSLRIAQGETLELVVENKKGGLPADTTMRYRLADGRILTRPLLRTTLNDKAGKSHQVGVDRFVIDKGPVFVRAVGGDDDQMAWHQLFVFPPAIINELQVKLTPPAYSGKPKRSLAKNVGHIKGLVGTVVDITARISKPLRAAGLSFSDEPPQNIDLAGERQRFKVAFVIKQPGRSEYWFELTDKDGFQSTEVPHYEIHGIEDSAPAVFIEKPETDITVTANAVVPLRIVAKDDLRLKDIQLRLRRDSSRETPSSVYPLNTEDGEKRQIVVEHLWQLSPFSLAPGMRLIFRAEAADYFDLGPKHVGTSLERTLSVVSSEEKVAEVARRNSELLEEFDRVHKIQSRSHDQIEELQIQYDKVGRFQPNDVDSMKRIELDQRQLESRLVGPVQGVKSKANQLLDELKNNRINDEEVSQRLGMIADELSILQEKNFPAIERNLTQARKAVQSDPAQPKDPTTDRQRQAKLLSVVGENQKSVLEALGFLKQQLSHWHHRQDVATDLGELIEKQRLLNDESRTTGMATLSKNLSELSLQQQADLKKVASKQRKAAVALEAFRAKLAKNEAEMAKANPRAAETLRDAKDELDRRAIDGRMREAADQLGQNNVGRALENQQRILDELDSLSDVLKQQEATDTLSLVKKLNEAESDLAILHKKQEESLEQSERLRNIVNPQDRGRELKTLLKRQKELRENTASLARRLRRLKAREASQSATRATSRMEDAERGLQNNGDTQTAQQEALDDIEQARSELAQRRREAEAQLAQELLERIGDQLHGMMKRQQAVIDETVRLEDARRLRGNWSRGQLKSLRALADIEAVLKEETDQLVELLRGAEVFAMALRGASRRMAKAAGRLSDRKTDDRTVALETAAMRRFSDLIQALKQEKENADNTPPPQQQAAMQSNQPGERIPHLAQLKMLKSLQQEIIQRTIELNAMQKDKQQLTDEQREEIDSLALEQGELADLSHSLVQMLADPVDGAGLLNQNDDPKEDR